MKRELKLISCKTCIYPTSRGLPLITKWNCPIDSVVHNENYSCNEWQSCELANNELKHLIMDFIQTDGWVPTDKEHGLYLLIKKYINEHT